MADGMNERFDNLERLMVDIKESLEAEMGGLKTQMQGGFSSVNTKLDDMSTRLDRQAGLLRAGGQRIVRLDDWAEKVDKSLEAKDREIAELRDRVIRLEQRKSA
jgi:predicted  nucleic acid-binding Zn-ribbon protein